MGGELKLKSEQGKGSEFYFTVEFPLAMLESEEEKEETPQSLGEIRILLAEDNDLNAEIAEELLQMKGAQVCRAENGETALKMFRDSSEGEFQVILMDLQMPVWTGWKHAGPSGSWNGRMRRCSHYCHDCEFL